MQLDLKNYAKKGFFLQSKGFVDNNGWYSSGFSNLCSVNIYLFKANNDAGDKFTLIVPPSSNKVVFAQSVNPLYNNENCGILVEVANWSDFVKVLVLFFIYLFPCFFVKVQVSLDKLLN